MFRKIALGLLIILMGLSIIIATRPPTFHVDRSTIVAAPPEKIFEHVNDFQKWRGWSPYEQLDPDMKRTYEGALAGEGASYAWEGDDKAGEGKMTIEKSDKNKELAIKIEFKKPMAVTNKITFTFVPVAEGTKVTWAMDGDNNFFSKAFQLFVDFDKMVGTDFEKGLASLKDVAEKESKEEKKPEVPEKK